MSRRAVAPVVGVVLVLAVVVALAGVVGVFVVGVGGQTGDAPKATISVDIGEADHGNKKINLTHTSGDELDVRDLTVRVFVDGTPLKFQPKVPTSGGMKGFDGFPDGPFDGSQDNIWTAGEVASFTIAGTNSPQPTDGSEITVKFYVDGTAVATARA